MGPIATAGRADRPAAAYNRAMQSRPRLIALVSLPLLLATVPWSADSARTFAGLPLWALYSLVATVAYAGWLCFALKRVFGDAPDQATAPPTADPDEQLRAPR